MKNIIKEEMDYEKKYMAALERAKRLHSEPTGGTERIVCEQIFPELAESEDERIRKEIIAFLKENLETGGRADETWSISGLERWIAWLEKQEQKETTSDDYEYPPMDRKLNPTDIDCKQDIII